MCKVMSLEEKLLMTLKGTEISNATKAEVLNELYDLGIQLHVLTMSEFFDNKTIIDFVRLSKIVQKLKG